MVSLFLLTLYQERPLFFLSEDDFAALPPDPLTPTSPTPLEPSKLWPTFGDSSLTGVAQGSVVWPSISFARSMLSPGAATIGPLSELEPLCRKEPFSVHLELSLTSVVSRLRLGVLISILSQRVTATGVDQLEKQGKLHSGCYFNR